MRWWIGLFLAVVFTVGYVAQNYGFDSGLTQGRAAGEAAGRREAKQEMERLIVLNEARANAQAPKWMDQFMLSFYRHNEEDVAYVVNHLGPDLQAGMDIASIQEALESVMSAYSGYVYGGTWNDGRFQVYMYLTKVDDRETPWFFWTEGEIVFDFQ